MSLSPGTRLGHYDVTALLGEGGMRRLIAFVRHADRPMALAPGTSIGHYDVTALPDEGGMGHVGVASQ